MGLFAALREKEFRCQHLNVSEYIHCCGCKIIYGFPQGNDADYETLKPRIKRELDWILKNNNNSLMQLIINHHQVKHFDEPIKEAGFTCVMRDVYHSGHGNNLSLYAWEKYEKRKPLQ